MQKCNFNKFGLQLYGNHISGWVFSDIIAAYLQNTFFEEHQWKTAFEFVML